jgi:hypothetical protein
MKTPDLSVSVTGFFRSHLTAERNLSQHTTEPPHELRTPS